MGAPWRTQGVCQTAPRGPVANRDLRQKPSGAPRSCHAPAMTPPSVCLIRGVPQLPWHNPSECKANGFAYSSPRIAVVLQRKDLVNTYGNADPGRGLWHGNSAMQRSGDNPIATSLGHGLAKALQMHRVSLVRCMKRSEDYHLSRL